ncbi:hypothetical protein CHS0354_004766 [Potamilus streckersoni]|uniref:Uncharacterized protein n=1 Tax=Potamilus streckersoni TaxID=2493646 RepID=A0AAE0TD20_9BIVA|nr:hypothetical protein CHS0354_004766 [Potamilus streckersoni]
MVVPKSSGENIFTEVKKKREIGEETQDIWQMLSMTLFMFYHDVNKLVIITVANVNFCHQPQENSSFGKTITVVRQFLHKLKTCLIKSDYLLCQAYKIVTFLCSIEHME